MKCVSSKAAAAAASRVTFGLALHRCAGVRFGLPPYEPVSCLGKDYVARVVGKSEVEVSSAFHEYL